MIKHRVIMAIAALLLIVGLVAFPVRVDQDRAGTRLMIGSVVAAMDVDADYTCDGSEDDITFQAALNALPATGGILYVMGGDYHFRDGYSVTRAIDNVSIVGLGAATRFIGDNATDIFIAGGDSWLFCNLWTDAGGINMTGTHNWCWLNIGIDTLVYPVLTESGGGSMTEHGNEWHSVDFATVSTVNDLAGQLGELQSDVSDLGTAVDNLISDLTACESDIDNLQGNVTELQSWLSGNISALTANVTNLQSWLSGNISALAANDTNLQSWLSGNVSALAANISMTQSWLSGNISALAANDTNLQSWLSGNISALAANITNLQSWLSGNVSALAANISMTQSWLSGNVSALAANISMTQSWLSGNVSALAANDTMTQSWLSGNISAIDDLAIIYVIDGGGSAITTGVKGDLEIPFPCTITGWTITADQSGSIVIDVWKDSYTNYPATVADTIAGSEKPTISSSTKGQDLTLTTWTTGITSTNNTLRFNVDSVSTVTRVTLTIRATKVI